MFNISIKLKRRVFLKSCLISGINKFTLKEYDKKIVSFCDKLGIIVEDDYKYYTGVSCTYSPYISWLGIGQRWWTKSANSQSHTSIWYVDAENKLNVQNYSKTETGILREKSKEDFV